MKKIILTASFAFISAIELASAQSTNEAGDQSIVLSRNEAINAQSFRLDLNTPTSPGFAVIAASPDNIVKPGNLQELALSTASFLEDGRVNPGLALNFQPFWMFNSNDTITLEEYSGFNLDGSVRQNAMSAGQRILARTQLSLASVQGHTASATTGARYGVGFHTELLDGRDPRNIQSAKCQIEAFDRYGTTPFAEFAQKVAEEKARRLAADPTLDEDELIVAITQELAAKHNNADYVKAEAKCREEAAFRVSRAASWQFGLGSAGRSSDASFDNLRFSGGSGWTTFVRPFGQNKSLSFHGKVDLDREFDFGGGTTRSGNAYNGAISLAFEEPMSWKLEATASLHFRDFSNNSFDDNYFQFSTTGSFKLSEGVWLEGSFGTRTGSQSMDDAFSLIKLKMDISSQAQAFLK